MTGAHLPMERDFAWGVQQTPGGGFLEEIADLLAMRGVELTLPLICCALALRSRNYAVAAGILVIFLGLALNSPLKTLIERERPTTSDLLVRESGPGFGYPSGHTMTATLLYGYVMLWGATHLHRPAAATVAVICTACIALVGFDRVWNGAHWPSDVLGGLTIGIVLVALAEWAPRVMLTRDRGPQLAAIPIRDE